MAEPATDFTLDSAALLAAEEHEVSIVGRSPTYLAWRRLRRNYVALFSLVVFVLIVACCALAPVYAHRIAHTGPNEIHATEHVRVGGKDRQVVGGGSYLDPKTNQFVVRGISVLGPTWWHADGRFVLGSDALGRDVAVRLLYGGLNSLKIGIGSALICSFIAIVLALLAGFFRGWVDWIISRFFDLIWAFPVLLLAIALGSALQINGFHHFGINIKPGSLWIPLLVISYVLIPYIGRPIRGQILSLREKEFVEAARALGASKTRQVVRHILPNALGPVIVAATIDVAAAIIAESTLSFLGLGFPPDIPTWGRILYDAKDYLDIAPHWALFPGAAIFLTVLTINFIGDGLRDALDPRKVM
jgi:peptide/nickel transport system permease protein